MRNTFPLIPQRWWSVVSELERRKDHRHRRGGHRKPRRPGWQRARVGNRKKDAGSNRNHHRVVCAGESATQSRERVSLRVTPTHYARLMVYGRRIGTTTARVEVLTD